LFKYVKDIAKSTFNKDKKVLKKRLFLDEEEDSDICKEF